MSEYSADPDESPDLDSTQRMRAITLPELHDSEARKWYVIQVVVSDKPINLDAIPRIAVFRAHRLYAVVDKQRDATLYALRLGFFSDEESAQVVCGHLRTYFSAPSVVRVSAAEQARFAQPSASSGATQQTKSSADP